MTAIDRAQLQQRADAGDGAALHMLALLTARGVDQPRDLGLALDLLERSAAAGDARAAAQRPVLAGFDAVAWMKPPAARMVFESPRIGVIERFLSPEICASLVAYARDEVRPAVVIDSHTGQDRPDPSRTNTAFVADLARSNLIVQLVAARIEAALQAPVAHHEEPSILRYEVGQTFAPHFDFLDPTQPALRQRMQSIGQRVITFLIYLNDRYEGGETDFPRLDWRYRGRTGDALFFWNITQQGQVEPKLLHAGLPPTSGKKWLYSQWIRSRPIALI